MVSIVFQQSLVTITSNLLLLWFETAFNNVYCHMYTVLHKVIFIFAFACLIKALQPSNLC